MELTHLALLSTLYLQLLWHDWNSSRVVNDFFNSTLSLPKASGKIQEEMFKCMQVEMQSCESVIKHNPVSQTSKTRELKSNMGRGVYILRPLGKSARASAPPGPLQGLWIAHYSPWKAAGPLQWCWSVSPLQDGLHSGYPGICWFHCWSPLLLICSLPYGPWFYSHFGPCMVWPTSNSVQCKTGVERKEKK